MTGIDLDRPILSAMRADVEPLRLDQTVAQALTRIRAHPPTGRIIYFYVTDDDRRLVGVVPTRHLLLSEPSTPLAAIVIRHVVAIPSSATILEACEFFVLHRYLAFPVVDEDRRFLGIVDVELYTDRLGDLGRRDDVDDLFQLVGMHAARARRGGVGNAVRQRFPWLMCNIVGGLLAAGLTGLFKGLLDRHVVIALFIPVVLGLAESVSIQSITIALQRLHAEALTRRSILSALGRELATGLALGLACGLLVGLFAWGWKGPIALGLALFGSIGLAMAAAALVALGLPLILHALRRDPRVAAGPIALVAADFISLTLYYLTTQAILD